MSSCVFNVVVVERRSDIDVDGVIVTLFSSKPDSTGFLLLLLLLTMLTLLTLVIVERTWDFLVAFDVTLALIVSVDVAFSSSIVADSVVVATSSVAVVVAGVVVVIDM